MRIFLTKGRRYVFRFLLRGRRWGKRTGHHAGLLAICPLWVGGENLPASALTPCSLQSGLTAFGQRRTSRTVDCSMAFASDNGKLSDAIRDALKNVA
jgi:hypothetical protein